MKSNVKSGYKIPEKVNGDLTELNEYFMVEFTQIVDNHSTGLVPYTDLADLTISPFPEKTTMKSAFCMSVGELMYIVINTRTEM